jgi:hypothetical protein
MEQKKAGSAHAETGLLLRRFGAGDRIRTGDVNLGKVALYH